MNFKLRQVIVNYLPFLLILILFFALRIPHLTREFTLEEPYIVRSAIAISQTGYPIIYSGEQNPEVINLWKPPGLVFFLAIIFKFFGVSEITARLLPILFSFAQLIVLMYFIFHLFAKFHPQLLAIFAGFLFAVHPYSVLNSFQVDIDGGVFSFFSTFFLFLAVSKILSKKNQFLDFIQLGIIFFFAFLTKFEPSVIAFLIVLVFSFLMNRNFLPKFILSVGVAILLFFSFFFLYNLYFGYPEEFFTPLTTIARVSSTFFAPKFAGIGADNNPINFWVGSFLIGIRFLSWLTIPTILLTFYCVLRFLKEKIYLKNPQLKFVFLSFVVFSLVYLVFGWAGDYPRYFAPSLPFLFLFLSYIVIYDFEKFKIPRLNFNLIYSSVVTLLLTLTAFRLNLTFQDRITGWTPNLVLPFFAIFTGGFVLIIFITNFFKKYTQILLILLISVNLAFFFLGNIHDINANYSLINFYGHSGFKEAGKFLRMNLDNQNSVILTVDPVAFYWEGKYIDYTTLAPYEEKHQKLIETVFTNQIQALALPQVFLTELASISKNHNFELETLLESKKHQHFGGIQGIEAYY